MAVLADAGLNVTLGVTPNRVGSNTFILELTDGLGNPVDVSSEAAVRIFRLDQGIRDVLVDTFVLEPDEPGTLSAKSDVLSIVGTWAAQVGLAVEGHEDLTIDYVFRVADRARQRPSPLNDMVHFLTGRRPELPRTGPLVPSGARSAEGHALLQQADAAMNRLSSLRERNNINGTITLPDYNAPGRMRYAVIGGGESVIDGDRQWYRRDDSPWRDQPRTAGFRFPEFRYADDPAGVRIEGVHQLAGRPHHLVSFYSARDDAEYWFWIDEETRHLSRLVMNVPPSHYMVSIFDGHDDTEEIPVPRGPDDRSIAAPAVPEKVSCQSYLP